MSTPTLRMEWGNTLYEMVSWGEIFCLGFERVEGAELVVK